MTVIQIKRVYDPFAQEDGARILPHGLDIRKDLLTGSRRHMSGYSSDKVLAEKLWETALEAIGATEIDAACAISVRGWIAIGIQRMIRQGRISPADLTQAQANLRRFIELLKNEAIFLGTTWRLDSNTFRATRKRLRLRASMTTFELWPFWPHNFVVS
jgi:hypothetical protein